MASVTPGILSKLLQNLSNTLVPLPGLNSNTLILSLCWMNSLFKDYFLAQRMKYLLEINTMKKADNNSVSNTVNRAAAPAAKKSPVVGGTAPSNPGGKAGNKKAENVKDPKQGNIMSFFKRV